MATDGSLIFDTAIDNSGFNNGISTLQIAAGNAIGNIAASMIQQISDIVAQVPAQMVTVGSSFEASMSQVAATMGITSAAEEFDILSDAAKEMGEATKFSASQAGEALNYLALAGYDAEKAVNALPTVLNVAAAGGMELAAASDMVTDAMSALGLETSQMSDFSDKLAVTAQKSNTSVAQLGEAILTVGGTAKSLAGGVAEMNTVLGILADNGIKGAEGGTALRNVILSLTAPTSTAAAALENLKVSAFDVNGNMRPLEDTFADINTALSQLTEQDKNAVLSDIFNKVDLKSVNALLGTSAARFDELSGYIDNCSGAAADMAKTMDDNLKGDLTIMQSALEGLGIAAYEKFQTPMRDAVQSVTADIGTLSTSLSSGELSAGFDKISEGLSQLVSTVSDFLANDVIPAVITGLSNIIDHSNEILALIGGIGAAIAVVKIVPIITNVVTAISAANKALVLLSAETNIAAFQQVALSSGLSLTEIAVGLFTKKITLATAAQAAFNAVSQSTLITIAASTAALAALAAVTIGAALAFKNYVDNMETAAAVDPWYEQAQKNVDAIKSEQQAYKELLKSRNENISAGNAQADNIQRLWSELQNYVDVNGNVISDNERASEIIGTLNSVYGMNIEYINGQIQAYGELAGSMDEYIAKLRLESKIRSGQEAYDEAIKNQEECNNKRLELEEQLNTKIAAFQATDNNDVKGVFAVQIGALREEIAALDDTAKMYEDTIADYEGLFSESVSTGDTSAASQYIDDAAEDLANATETLKTEWQAAEHEYAIGVITSEQELYNRKKEIWDKYGDESNSDHWKYYEDLYDMQQDFADKSKDAYDKQLQDEWDAIDHSNALGLENDEQTLQRKLDFIQKYCPEYSEEWYDYYKDVYDMQQAEEKKQLDSLKDSMSDQVDTVKDSLNSILKAYKDSYKDIKDNIDSYKKKLLSVGDAFEVIENKDGSKTLKVNNLKEQMAEMRKYNDYIKKLRDEGASAGLIAELTSMDFADGSAFAKSLASLSEEDFAEINNYYQQRDELAQSLAEDMYQPDITNLNNTLEADITAQFEQLPEAIRAAGIDAVNAFIMGLGDGDLYEQVNTFCNNFVQACNEGIKNTDTTIDLSGLTDTDTYAMGQQLGNDFVAGFNDAAADIQATVQSEQAQITASYTAGSKSSDTAQTSADGKTERIIIENHIKAELDVDGEKMAEKVIEKTETINRRKGK